MRRILVTGASGFIGRSLCADLVCRGFEVHRAVRDTRRAEDGVGKIFEVGEIGAKTDWLAALDGVESIIHLAARVHVMRETAIDPIAAFHAVNVAGTERLARAAEVYGVRRFVFVSSIKVNGERTLLAPFSEGDMPSPQDPYGVSKHKAEQILLQLAKETGLEVVIVRPPLVYGPGVGGNFYRLLKLVQHGVPLPLSLIQNQRSMIYLGNFIDALATCAIHPEAAGNVYLVSDGEDVSTPRLLRDLSRLMRKPTRLWPLSPYLLKLLGQLTGKSDEVERLMDSLVIDDLKIRRELMWIPPFTLEQGLEETVRWFMNEAK